MRAEDEPQVRHPQAGGPEPGGGGGSQFGNPGGPNKILCHPDQLSFRRATAQPLVAAIFYLSSHKGREPLWLSFEAFPGLFWGGRACWGLLGSDLAERREGATAGLGRVRLSIGGIARFKMATAVRQSIRLTSTTTLASRKVAKKMGMWTQMHPVSSGEGQKVQPGVKFVHDTDSRGQV